MPSYDMGCSLEASMSQGVLTFYKDGAFTIVNNCQRTLPAILFTAWQCQTGPVRTLAKGSDQLSSTNRSSRSTAMQDRRQ
jgi:hypothetical protein